MQFQDSICLRYIISTFNHSAFFRGSRIWALN